MTNTSSTSAYKLPKTVRNVFITKFKEQKNDNGEIEKVYLEEDILEIINDWSKTYEGIKYYFILHDSDEIMEEDLDTVDKDGNEIWTENDIGNPKAPHYHIMLRFPNPTASKYVLQRFEPCHFRPVRNKIRALQYLIHKNSGGLKFKYEWEDVITNDHLTIEKVKNIDATLNIEEIIFKINNGEINRYNLVSEVPIFTYADSKLKAKINNALEYYENNILRDPKRNIFIYVLQGEAGAGKTVFATEYCKRKGWSYSISSSSNDPWSSYNGSDVFILDDLRQSTFSIQDLIKMLDPYHQSTNKSRYYNKLFVGKAIIITTNVDIQDWYKKVDKDTRKALYRRIDVIYQFKNTYEENVAEYYPIEYKDGFFIEYYDTIYTFRYENIIEKYEDNDRLLSYPEFIMNSKTDNENKNRDRDPYIIRGKDGYRYDIEGFGTTTFGDEEPSELDITEEIDEELITVTQYVPTKKVKYNAIKIKETNNNSFGNLNSSTSSEYEISDTDDEF